jgi:HPt (histidine-containing phosphotransfer) domain-containing protein
MRIPFWRSGKVESAAIGTAQAGIANLDLTAMKERFRDRLRDDRAILAQHTDRLDAPTDELIAIVHRLAGSAGMLGYTKISALAGTLDDDFAEPSIDRRAVFLELLGALQEEESVTPTGVA